MAWWKAQCESRTNPKFATAGRDASWLWYCANCYAREQLTDGHIPGHMLASLVPGMSISQVRKAIQRLIDAKLAHATDDGGFTIHDFLEHHPSKQKVLSDRRADSDRKRPQFDSDSNWKEGQGQDNSESPRTRAGASTSSDLLISEEKKHHPIQELLAFHEECFIAKTRGERPAKYTAADAKHAKDLIDRHGPEKARAIVRQAFVTADEFLVKTGRSMGIIVSSSVQNRLIAELASRKTASLESPPEHPHLKKLRQMGVSHG
jgi:hypothetical protein